MGSMKKILVTGADGFIGSHLCEALVTRGYAVKAFVQYNSFSSWGWLDHSSLASQMEIFPGDVRDPNGVRTATRDCDAVLHLAALIAIPYSYNSPDAYVDTNIKGTLNILQAARDLEVERCIHTSTSEVYGTAQFVPITEEHPLQGQSPYSATKIAADQLALSFYRSFGQPVSILRPFNTYGPRQSARAIIPTIITQIANGARRIKLGSLHPTRDFTYVTDTADAFIAMLECPLQNIVGEVFNGGSGFEVSMGDTARMIAQVMEANIEIICDEQRLRPKNSEVERLWADNTRLTTLTGWKPEHGDLEGFRRGLEKTAQWFAHPKNLAGYKSGIYNI